VIILAVIGFFIFRFLTNKKKNEEEAGTLLDPNAKSNADELVERNDVPDP
jgi:hypothetical protein